MSSPNPDYFQKLQEHQIITHINNGMPELITPDMEQKYYNVPSGSTTDTSANDTGASS